MNSFSTDSNEKEINGDSSASLPDSNFVEESLPLVNDVSLVCEMNKKNGKYQCRNELKRSLTKKEMSNFSTDQKKKKTDGDLKEYLPTSKFLELETYDSLVSYCGKFSETKTANKLKVKVVPSPIDTDKNIYQFLTDDEIKSKSEPWPMEITDLPQTNSTSRKNFRPLETSGISQNISKKQSNQIQKCGEVAKLQGIIIVKSIKNENKNKQCIPYALECNPGVLFFKMGF